MIDLFIDTQPQSISFDRFWANVPHKIGKKAAQKAWKKLKPQERALAAEMVTAFYAWFKQTYPTASPLHPSTYLNGDRWQDVQSEPEKKGDVEEAIRKGLQSKVPAVREHAILMAKRNGIIIGQNAGAEK